MAKKTFEIPSGKKPFFNNPNTHLAHYVPVVTTYPWSECTNNTDESTVETIFSMLNTENTEQWGIGIENGSEWSNGTVKFSIGPRKEVNLERWTTLVPEAFFYSFLANFATRIASFIFYWQEALKAEKWKPLVKTIWDPHESYDWMD